MNALKQAVATAAINYIDDNTIIGVGHGSTVNYFIEALSSIKNRIDACVASSKATEQLLRKHGIPVVSLNVAAEVALYIDGADEVNARCEMIKGGGGALTGEKIVATVAKKFICIVDESKIVRRLGSFPVAVEVLPMARSFVAREIVKLGGSPEYREGFVTDSGNIILDVYNLDIQVPIKLEEEISIIPGVIENGIFARRTADKVLVARDGGLDVLN